MISNTFIGVSKKFHIISHNCIFTLPKSSRNYITRGFFLKFFIHFLNNFLENYYHLGGKTNTNLCETFSICRQQILIDFCSNRPFPNTLLDLLNFHPFPKQIDRPLTLKTTLSIAQKRHFRTFPPSILTHFLTNF